MKKFICFCTAIFLFTFTVYSHPGRTDSNGGHYNRSTGEYHYHNGDYAGREQSGSTSPKEEKPFTPPKEPKTPKPKLFIEIIKPDATFRKGGTYEFSAKIPEGYSLDQVVWSSKDKSVASFEGNKLTIHGVGSVQIVAKIEDVSDAVTFDTEHSNAYECLEQIFPFIWGLIILFVVVASFLSASKKEKVKDSAYIFGCSIYILAFILFVLMIVQHFIE